MSKKIAAKKNAAWYSKLPPLLFVLVILILALILTGQATPEIAIGLVAAVLIGAGGGAMTKALIDKRRAGQ